MSRIVTFSHYKIMVTDLSSIRNPPGSLLVTCNLIFSRDSDLRTRFKDVDILKKDVDILVLVT